MYRNSITFWAGNYSRDLVWYLLYVISHGEYMESWLGCTTSTVIKWNLLFWYLIQHSEKKTEETNAEGVDFWGPAKTIHNIFCLGYFEKLTKEWPGGVHIFMNISPRVPGDRPLMAIRYK